MQENNRLRVAICGGGIAGLCLAVTLSKYCHIQVSVYEAASRFKEIGAGVGFWSRTWKIIEQMGLASQVMSIANIPPDDKDGIVFEFRRSDEPNEGFTFFTYERPYGCIHFHRAEFLDVLVDNLPSGVAHFGKKLIKYVEAAPGTPMTLHFADGSTDTCDLLVGCDGIKSTIRCQLYTDMAKREGKPELLRHVEPMWTGTSVYRGLIPLDRLPSSRNGEPHRATSTPVMYCGKGKHIVSYAISQVSLLNVVAAVSQPEKYGQFHPDPWMSECSADELLETFSDWEPEVGQILKCIEKPTRWAVHQIRPLPSFFTGHVLLIGDAAHACAPHQAAGAGQGIEDAYVLAHLLGNITSATQLSSALEAFQHVRMPLANHVLRASYESGKMYEFLSPDEDDYTKLIPAILAQWSWLDETDPVQEAERARKYMEGLLSH